MIICPISRSMVKEKSLCKFVLGEELDLRLITSFAQNILGRHVLRFLLSIPYILFSERFNFSVILSNEFDTFLTKSGLLVRSPDIQLSFSANSIHLVSFILSLFLQATLITISSYSNRQHRFCTSN